MVKKIRAADLSDDSDEDVKDEQRRLIACFEALDHFGAVVLADAPDNIDFSTCEDDMDEQIKSSENLGPILKPRMN